ncbi:unnamed protein product [Spirodela intermedia]|uniref:Uncharacterized protein n=1 Tax=Spirodela intermedia TaxID=51605 RepID=A0A7I8KIS0_SPIIN|nr:unnamed protein product [Spirodela intermedia]
MIHQLRGFLGLTGYYWCFIAYYADAAFRQLKEALTTTAVPALLDFSIPFDMESEGFSTILVVVDCLSKYMYFSPIKHPFTASEITHVFLRDIVHLHEIP